MILHTTVSTDGMDNVLRRLEFHKRSRSKANLSDAALAGANKARELIINEMMMPKRGIFYGKPWLPVTSSAPGEMPAVQTGELAFNMTTEKMAGTPYSGQAKLEAHGRKAVWLEYGTSKMPGGRPYMRTGVVKYRPAIIHAMKAAMPKG